MSVSQRIGLIAGEGELPLYFVRQANSRGFSVFTVAIKGAASKRLDALSEAVEWISIGQLGKLLSFFRRSGIRRAVLQGKVQHASVLKRIKPDFRALAFLARLKDRSGPFLLKALAKELADNGVRLLDARFLMSGLLSPPGSPTRKKPNKEDFRACRLALRKATILANLGIGQSLLVKKGAVVAVEGVEGTDETIQRAGRWAGPGTILVKTIASSQDWRFDVPTVGIKTIQTMAKAGVRGLAIEKGNCFILSKEKTLSCADKNGIFIAVF